MRKVALFSLFRHQRFEFATSDQEIVKINRV